MNPPVLNVSLVLDFLVLTLSSASELVGYGVSEVVPFGLAATMEAATKRPRRYAWHNMMNGS